MHRHLNDSPSLSQGCRAEEEHAVNMHFAPSTIHYSGSHWAPTYHNNRKLTTGGWQMRNMRAHPSSSPLVFLFMHVHSASPCVISPSHRDGVWARKRPAGWKSGKKNTLQWSASPPCAEIALLQPHDSLDYPRRSPPSDMTQYEGWWMRQLGGCGGGSGQKDKQIKWKKKKRILK